MAGAVRKRLGRLKKPAAGRANRSLEGRKIGPAGRAEIGNAGIAGRRIAVGAGGRQDTIENALKEVHDAS